MSTRMTASRRLEISKRVAELDSGQVQTTSWKSAKRNLAKYLCPLNRRDFIPRLAPNMTRHLTGTSSEADAAFRFDAEVDRACRRSSPHLNAGRKAHTRLVVSSSDIFLSFWSIVSRPGVDPDPRRCPYQP